MLTDKREILHIKSYFSKHANEEIILEIIEYCIAIFNSAVGKNFLNMQNLKIEFFNLENGIAVYERFCKQYFPSYLGKYHDDYTQDGYMNSFAAQAFINHDTYGILCSLDTDVDPNSWYETILHEMVHIYCTTHESNGDNFFDKYCVNKKNNFKDGTMGAGMDLVEINANNTPPIVKIMDYGKFKYDQKKRANEARKNQKTVEMKEVWVKPFIEENDLNIKMKKVFEFLDGGNKVKIAVMTRGSKKVLARGKDAVPELFARILEICVYH